MCVCVDVLLALSTAKYSDIANQLALGSPLNGYKEQLSTLQPMQLAINIHQKPSIGHCPKLEEDTCPSWDQFNNHTAL